MSFSTARLTVLVLLAGLVLLFPADGLRALGLGEARVDSYLGQPLDVTIRLIEVEAGELGGVTVSPAAPEDFDRLDMPSDVLGLGLDVSVDQSTDPPSIRVQSNRAVEDPVVQILIDARWGSGRMLREYTLFLDPPTVDSPPPVRRDSDVPEAGESAEPVESEPESTRPAPSPPRDEPAVERESTTDPAVGATDGGVSVERGDTLWSIAYDWRPDTGLSMDQVMLAIFEQNRRAFGDNINHLRSGAELNMPDVDDVRGVEQARAEQRIREHMQAWQQRQPTGEVPEVTDAGVAETEVTEPAPAAEEEPEVEHRLDVVPPEEDEFADGPVVSEGEIRRVQGAVTDIEDEIMSERLESEEFDERIAEIREALSARDAAGLAVAEEALAELEARLREVRQQQPETDAEEDEVSTYFEDLESELVDDEDQTEADADPVPDPAVAESDPVESSTEDAAEPTQEEAVETAEDSDAATMPTTPTPTGGSDLPAWLWPVAALGGVLLLGAGFWVLYRRRSSDAGTGVAGRDADPEQKARAAVAADLGNLAAHLELLRVLADRDNSKGFSNALDEMYRQVTDESDEHWQEALNLAVQTAPNHPLLTPAETPVEESDDLEQRADQLMDMLETDTGEGADETAEADREQSEAADESEALADLDLPEDTQPAGEQPGTESGADSEEEFGEDLDLAELSDRLDEPAPPPADRELDIDDDSDLGELDLDEEPQVETEPGHESALELEPERGEAAEPETDRGKAAEPETEGDMDLDFEFTSSADADELDTGLDQPVSDAEADAGETAQSGGEQADESDTDLELDLDTGSSADDADLAYDLEAEGSGAEESPDTGEADDEIPAPGAEVETDELPAFGDETEEPTSGDETEEPPALDEQTEEPSFGEESEETPQPEDETGQSPALGDEDADVKLDLARAYIAVDLSDSARDILEEVVSGGSAEKQDEARKLLDEL